MCSRTACMAECPLLFLVNSNLSELAILWRTNHSCHPRMRSSMLWEVVICGTMLHYVLRAALPLCFTHTRGANQDFWVPLPQGPVQNPMQRLKCLHLWPEAQSISKRKLPQGNNATMLPLRPVPSAWWYHTTMHFLPLCWLRNLRHQLKTCKIAVSSQRKLNASKILTRHQLFRHPVGSMY